MPENTNHFSGDVVFGISPEARRELGMERSNLKAQLRYGHSGLGKEWRINTERMIFAM